MAISPGGSSGLTRGIDTQKPASLNAYGLDSATPPRVYTFSAEHAACTHSNHRAPRKEETLLLLYHNAWCFVQRFRCDSNKCFSQVKTPPPPDQAEFLLDAVVRRAEWCYSAGEGLV